MLQKLKTFFVSQGFQSFSLCLVIALLAVNFYDRRAAVKEINANLEKFQLSRTMLNSRAKIQIILCNAALEGRRLNAEEVDSIKRLWTVAEYPRANEDDAK